MPLNFRLFVLFLLAGVYSLEYLCARYAHNFASSSIQIITHTQTHVKILSLLHMQFFCQLFGIFFVLNQNRIRRQTCSSLINCVFGCLLFASEYIHGLHQTHSWNLTRARSLWRIRLSTRNLWSTQLLSSLFFMEDSICGSEIETFIQPYKKPFRFENCRFLC